MNHKHNHGLNKKSQLVPNNQQHNNSNNQQLNFDFELDLDIGNSSLGIEISTDLFQKITLDDMHLVAWDKLFLTMEAILNRPDHDDADIRDQVSFCFFFFGFCFLVFVFWFLVFGFCFLVFVFLFLFLNIVP